MDRTRFARKEERQWPFQHHKNQYEENSKRIEELEKAKEEQEELISTLKEAKEVRSTLKQKGDRVGEKKSDKIG